MVLQVCNQRQLCPFSQLLSHVQNSRNSDLESVSVFFIAFIVRYLESKEHHFQISSLHVTSGLAEQLASTCLLSILRISLMTFVFTYLPVKSTQNTSGLPYSEHVSQAIWIHGSIAQLFSSMKPNSQMTTGSRERSSDDVV